MIVNDTGARKPCSLQACTRQAMRIVRWSGYFPVEGLNQLTADGTKFKIKSLYGVYNVLTFIGQAVMLCFSFYFFLNNEVTLVSASNVVFYLTNFTTAISLVRLAKRWSALMKVAEETEKSLTILKMDDYTIKKSNMLAYIMSIIALATQILWFNYSIKLVMECLSITSLTDINDEVIAAYMNIKMYYIFNYVSYSSLRAVLFFIINIQTTFMWSYVSVLTISFSIYIASYFYKLNQIIGSKKNNSTISWIQLREHYSKLVMLLTEIDAEISIIVLLSFFKEMLFICIQLFMLQQSSTYFIYNRHSMDIKKCNAEISIRVLSSLNYTVAYYTSFSFNVIKFILLSLFAANVHNTAQKAIIPVYSVKSAEYDQEVLRFQLILRFATVALSGKFFYVSRNTILQIISTIITYELVLLQFTKIYTEEDIVSNTTTTVATSLF